MALSAQARFGSLEVSFGVQVDADFLACHPGRGQNLSCIEVQI
jgi:hypothetical protein